MWPEADRPGRMRSMNIFDKAKTKAEELYGRAAELYGESHGDAAAKMDGEAHRLEAEAEAAEHERAEERDGDDGLAGAR
jgi:uncharacterized protein YjbJ (UPF0337 family)